ncbi:hypothetical protein [Rahnella sp. ChDrAdgB13]|uniref:hypothetical protein n=1 Tax=Rahnella sp. ChDrAdgB13 TaxID=1850581 RepID=UPI001AD88970|nr:hypothetical protein [Rahnella sp. ChDrAdgB13]
MTRSYSDPTRKVLQKIISVISRPALAAQGFPRFSQFPTVLTARQFDRDGKQRDPIKNNQLNKWLAGDPSVFFAKLCKTLRSVQNQ